ncbi:unnamed protein product [Prunus brigantina]
MVPVDPPPVTPHRLSGIMIRSVSIRLACQSLFLTWVFQTFDFRLQPPRASLPLTVAVVSAAVDVTQEPLAEDDIAVVEPLATATPILTPTASVSMSMPQPPLSQESTVMTELAVTETSNKTSIVPPAAEEPATSDDLAELYASLHEEGCSSISAPLDEDSRAAAERLREFLFLGVHEMTTAEAFMEFRSCLDMVMALESEELAQVEVQIAELQARRDLILQRRDGAVVVGTELKSSARQILKAATEKKRALAKRNLIRARWQADIDGGDIAWRRITCLIWGMFTEGI